MEGRMKQIAFIGVGGVGGYFGGKMTSLLEKYDDIKIHFIARGTHLAEIQEKGLLLKTKKEGECICKPTVVTDKIEALPMLDACFIAVKSYDLEKVLLRLKPCIKKETEIIPLLNGVDIPKRIRKVIQKGSVYPACVYVGTHIEKPGVVTQNGGSCSIILGKDESVPHQKPDWLMILMDEARINYQWHEQCSMEIWKKFLFIAAYGLMTSAYHKTIGQVYEDDLLKGKTLEIMREIVRVGHKEGVLLTEENVSEALEKAKAFPYETKTSFQRDYEKGGPDERELFGGTMLKLADGYQMPLPMIEQVYSLL